MYTFENYYWGLIGYAVGAGLLMWYLTWLMRHIPFRHLRNVVTLLFAAILFTPVLAYPDKPFLAPAFVVSLFEGLIFKTEQGAGRALLPVLFVYLVLVAGYGGWQWWQHLRAKGADLTPESTEQ